MRTHTPHDYWNVPQSSLTGRLEQVIKAIGRRGMIVQVKEAREQRVVLERQVTVRLVRGGGGRHRWITARRRNLIQLFLVSQQGNLLQGGHQRVVTLVRGAPQVLQVRLSHLLFLFLTEAWL